MTDMIGSNTLDKPAVSVSWTKNYVKVVGERMSATISIPRDSLRPVSDMHHWEYHDSLYHADEEYPNQSCEVCEKFGEKEI